MARKFVTKHKKQYMMDLTPLIDVVFLLLIFFMVTTTFSKFSSMDIKLPQASAEQTTAELKLVEVLLNFEKELSIRTQINEKSSIVNVEEKELKNRLKTIIDKSKTKNVSLIADEKLDYGYIIKIMSYIKEAKAEGISLKIEKSI